LSQAQMALALLLVAEAADEAEADMATETDPVVILKGFLAEVTDALIAGVR
jgi:hypothetical protein